MNKNYPLPLWILVIGAFAIGMTEFVIMGLLPNVASDLNVSVSTAGQLITGYALSVAIGGPIIVIATYKLSQKNILMLLMAIFILGNFLSVIAPTYGLLMTSRIITALAHGSFFGIGAIMAANLVAPNRRASAMALMFSGLTVSNIIGVPFGTFIGQHMGWRASFFIIALIGIVALIGIIFLVPKKESAEKATLIKELAVLKSGKLWLTLLVALFSLSSVFAVFTYITPILMQVTGFHASVVSLILVIFGVGVTVGNVIGGKLADWHMNKAIVRLLIVFELFFVLLYFMQFHKLLMVLGVFLFGVIAFSMLPSMQYRSMLVSKDAPTLSSTLNQSAMNVGNAMGAFVGGLSVAYFPLKHLVLIAPLLSLIGFILLVIQLSVAKRRTVYNVPISSEG